MPHRTSDTPPYQPPINQPRGHSLDESLIGRIQQAIRTQATPRHVPRLVIQVADIPRTRSGKITELAIRDVIHNRPVQNREALANPESLELFRDFPELMHALIT